MKIFGIEISSLSSESCLQDIEQNLAQSESNAEQCVIFTPNPEILLFAKKDAEFFALLQKANMLITDGIGLYIAFQILDNSWGKIINTLLLPYYFFNLFFRRKYLYKKYGERICGSDLTQAILKKCITLQKRIAILDVYSPGDTRKESFQKAFHSLLKNKFPGLVFDYYIYNPSEKSDIIAKIKKSDACVLFSTLGMKRQEESVIEIMEVCKNITLGLGVGSSFDYFIGFQKRAPKIWRILGCEWLYRLIFGHNKWKRLKRIYNAIFVFIYEVIASL